MGTCLSKKKGSSNPSPHAGTKSVLASSTAPPQQQKNHENGVTVTLSKPEIIVPPKKKNTVQEKMDPEVVKEDEEGQVKKEIFIIKHRKSHDEREKRSSKIPPFTEPANGLAPPGASSAATSETTTESESMGNKGVVGVRTSSCTKEEVDAILIQCGRLSRSSSGKAASSSAGGRKYSGSKRSYDFDHCDNDAISAEDDQKRVTPNASDNNSEEYDGVAAENRSRHRHNHHQHRQRNRQSPRPSSPSSQGRRRRTPSRERDQQQQQRSSSRERRVSRSPGRRSSETNTSNSNASNNNNNGSSSRPGKMVSVPPTVSSLVMDKSNNNGGGGGGGEQPAAATGIKRVTVKRSVGGDRSAASPRARSQSPHARANGNNANNQQQPSLSRNNSSRKAEHSPYRRNPLSEVDPNTLAYPQSNSTNNGSCKVQNKPKKEIETDTAIQKPNVDMNDNSRNRTSSRVALEKGVTTVSVNCHTKEVQEEEIIKVLSSVPPDNAVVKTMVMPQTLTRSRSSRRSRDFDINPEALLNPPVSYTSILLEDIQNFHQKNTQQQQQQPSSVSLPACLTKACSILEAVADLNSTNTTTSSNLSGGAFSDDNRRSPPTCQSIRNEYNVVPLKQVPDTKDPFVESEVVVSDDLMEPSLHKYVTVKRGGSIGVGGGVVDMEDQESSGSNSFTVSSSGQHQYWGISSSSWEPNSADSADCWTSREEGQNEKSPLGLGGTSLLLSSSEANKKKTLNSNNKGRECDHQHSSGIGRGRLGSNKGLNSLPVAST